MIIIPSYKQGKWSTEQLSSLLKITQLISGIARIQTKQSGLNP